MDYREILKDLKSKANPKNVLGMARFGINKNRTLGIPIPYLRRIARITGKDHKLAKDLWKSGIHEARILAGFVGEADKMTEQDMDSWVQDFDSWDVCDQVSSNLFDKTKFAYKKIFEWSKRKEEFVKRTAFTLMACLAVHDKKAKDRQFVEFFPLIAEGARDERNFVKKAVNWGLRQIGKRNQFLNKKAIKLAEEILRLGELENCRSAKWVARGAVGELKSPAVQKRLGGKVRAKV